MRRTSSRVAVALVAAALTAAAGGCRDRDAPRRDGAGDLRRYTVRGEVVQLPPAAAGVRTVSLRHEALDDFADASGTVVGMSAMRMSFEVAPAVSLEDVQVGDKVEVRLAVGWSPPLLRIEALRKLPAGTVLELRPARPPAGGGSAPPGR